MNTKITILDDETMDILLEESNQGYFALDERQDIFDEGKEDYIMETYGSVLNDLRVDTFYFEHPDDLEAVIKTSIKMNTSSFINQVGNMIYLQPMLSEALEENPFKKEERKIPVDFNYPREHLYIMNLTIPEGYEVSELPQSIKYLLPENGGGFLYHITRNGNNLQLLSRFKINRIIYYPENYSYLKELFDGIVAKHAEQIILTKSN